MGTADLLIFAFVASADAAVLALLHYRRQRRVRMERMMRSLRQAIQRDQPVAEPGGQLILQIS